MAAPRGSFARAHHPFPWSLKSLSIILAVVSCVSSPLAITRPHRKYLSLPLSLYRPPLAPTMTPSHNVILYLPSRGMPFARDLFAQLLMRRMQKPRPATLGPLGIGRAGGWSEGSRGGWRIECSVDWS